MESVTVCVHAPLCLSHTVLPPFQFLADRLLLSRHCTYFRSILAVQPTTPVLTAPIGVSPAVFHILLNYLTSGSLQLSTANASSVYHGASLLGIEVPQFKQLQPVNPQKTPVTEIATCDGPIKFTRVLNHNYKPSAQEQIQETPSAEPTYKCGCCSESFKSSYCFEKHKSRHLLPVDNPWGQRSVKSHNPSPTNARFYPCRACGRKFPSYYFVHKHRQFCDRQSMGLGTSK